MKIIVFTDLDGTLLDHETYAFTAAGEALALLRERAIPLILSTSKTAAEVAPLHAELGLGSAPVIVENGAGVFQPDQPPTEDDTDYRQIRAALDALPGELRAGFKGFGDMDADEIATLTGLPLGDAERAQQRNHSEPGQWRGAGRDLPTFLDMLAHQGISARRGGRFLTLSLGRTKADAMRDLVATLGPATTIALGDAPNDVEMLDAADYGVIVRNDSAPPLPALHGEAEGRILRTELEGPAGWNAAVLALLQTITAD